MDVIATYDEDEFVENFKFTVELFKIHRSVMSHDRFYKYLTEEFIYHSEKMRNSEKFSDEYFKHFDRHSKFIEIFESLIDDTFFIDEYKIYYT